MREVNVDASVDQLAQIGPVTYISRTAIYLMKNDAIGLAACELSEHPGKLASPAFRGGFLLFIPSRDLKAIALCVCVDGQSLLLQ